MSGIEVDNITSDAQNIVVRGSVGEFQMEIETRGSTITMPDITNTISGTLEVSEETPIIELKKIPLEEAKLLIHKYIKEHPGCRTSDLIIELALDPDLVIKALSQLKKEDRIEGRDIERE